MNEYNFTTNWVDHFAQDWRVHLQEFAHKPNLRALEIGSYEGRSTIWFLENILTNKLSSIICIDFFIRPNFIPNVVSFKDQVILIELDSALALRDPKFYNELFDFIYIDGSHKASDVLEDAVLSFRALKSKGILIFDDYLWTAADGATHEPKRGIDSFLTAFSDQFSIIDKGYQITIRKN